MAMLTAATMALVSTSYRLERKVLQVSETDAVFDAGLSRAIVGILDTNSANRWRPDGTPYLFNFNGHHLRIAVQDELGKIDLNVADESVLRRLLASAGLNEQQTETIVDRVLDWRGSSDLKRLHGASSADYAAAERSYHPRHGPFQTIDELRLVLGMTPSLFEQLRPALTVYTKNPMFDINVAPKEVLLTLPGYNIAKSQSIIAARRSGTLELNTRSLTIPADDLQSSHLAGRAFTVTLSSLTTGRHRDRSYVVQLTADANHPFIVLAMQ